MARRRRRSGGRRGGKRGFSLMGIVRGVFSVKGLITLALGAFVIKVIGGKAESWFGSIASKVTKKTA